MNATPEMTPAGATLSLVVKAWPAWLTTSSVPPSVMARKLAGAAALMAAARPVAIFASVSLAPTT